MPAAKSTLKALLNANYWMKALVIIGGFKVSQLAGAYIAPKLPLPPAVGVFIGPAAAIFGGKMLGGEHGTSLALGGMVAAGDAVLDMVGVGGLGA